MKYTCSKCSKELNLTSFTSVIVDGKIVTKQAYCCGKYMTEHNTNKGLATVVRNERNGK